MWVGVQTLLLRCGSKCFLSTEFSCCSALQFFIAKTSYSVYILCVLLCVGMNERLWKRTTARSWWFSSTTGPRGPTVSRGLYLLSCLARQLKSYLAGSLKLLNLWLEL